MLSDDLKSKYKFVYNYLMSDFTKGLLLVGSVGTGKTLMMRVYREIIKDAQGSPLISDIEDTNSIVRDFLINGFDVIEKYSRRHYFKNSKPKGFCIDDLGMEDSKVKSYGNEANVMEQILFSRYKEMQNNGMKTFATSNLPASKLATIYGDRVADRMVEMFTIIDVNGKSLRA